MEENLKKLVEISRYFGQNPDYILAGGGNTSYKDDEKIWVKSSGVSLATIEVDGFVCLDRQKMAVIAHKQYSSDSSRREEEVKSDLNQAILYPKERRPSVEASMHEVIRYPFVVHTHPTLINGLLCARQSREKVQELFGDDVVYVEYTDPGYVLFKAVISALEAYRATRGAEPKIILLENHGVFVAAESCDEIIDIYRDLEARLARLVEMPPQGTPRQFKDLQRISEFLKEHCGMEHAAILASRDKLTDFFVSEQEAFSVVSKPFTPDNIVYCKSNYLFISNRDYLVEAVKSFNKTHGYPPRIIAIQGQGLLAVEESEKSARIVLDVFRDMMKVSYLTRFFGGPRPMTANQIEFIDNWEVENYRRKVSKDS